MSEIVYITQDNMDSLMDDRLMLEALMQAGVENWEGWEQARQIYLDGLYGETDDNA